MARVEAGTGTGTINNILRNRTSNDHNCCVYLLQRLSSSGAPPKKKERKERKKDEEKRLLDLVISNTTDTCIVTFKTGKCARLKSRQQGGISKAF